MRPSLPVLSVLLLTISVTYADPFRYQQIERIPNSDVIRNEIPIATPSPAPHQEMSPVTPMTTSAPAANSSTEIHSNIDAIVIVNSSLENLNITASKVGSPATTRKPRPSTPGLTTGHPKPTKKPKPSKKPTTTRKPRPDVSVTAPVDCSGDIEFWPHEECNKFIWCVEGEQVIQRCSGNLYWDFKQEKCDWPNKVDTSHCTSPPPTVNIPITTTTTTTPVPPKDCDAEDEYFAHPDCDKYIWCVHGEPQTFVCPGGLYWDNEEEECGWNKKVPSSECNAPVKKNV